MSEIKYIKNGVVTMQWRADMFLTSKTRGFIAAVNPYTSQSGSEVLVVFQNNRAFVMMDSSGEYLTLEQIIGTVKALMLKDQSISDGWSEDNMVEIVSEDDVYQVGLGEDDYSDINDRIADLSDYYYEVVEDMS